MNILIIANSSVGLVKFRKELIIKILERHKVFIATKIDECENELRSIGAVSVDAMSALYDFSLYY